MLTLLTRSLWHSAARAAFVIAAFALLGACANVQGVAEVQRSGTPKNIIILFGDGAAATQWELGRYTSRALRNRSYAVTDVVFKEGTIGLLTTHSADSAVTDSAAAAAAMSTGYKTNNGMIGTTPDGKPVTTVMEAAKARGKRIGLVTTATVYDASPAGFSVHANSRRDSQEIVDQYLALEPDVLMGGGRDFFLPKGKPGGKRADGQDVIAAFAVKGYQVVQDPAALKTAAGRRLLALFSDDDMDLEIDRDPKQEPSTAEMAAAALRVLSANSPNGFVLFVENESIDTAGHRNDAAALMRDLWAFDDAVQVALEFRKRNPDTLIIVTGDHETGGLSWSYALIDLSSLSSKNRFYPGADHLERINRIRISLDKAAELIGKKPTAEVLDKVVAEHFPDFKLDSDLRAAILEQKTIERNVTTIPQGLLGRMIARQTGFYWGTTGHTTEPVVVGAMGPGESHFRGYMDNTDFAKALHRLIGGR
ncbi:MAG TPA: alkaline phosphatase [Burkholderiales bacterium]|nr:alkaline phosphatase [Burkholderiales bacterium]